MEAVHGIEKQVTVEGKPKSLKIPAGVDEGMQIRYDDFNLVISVRPDKNYKRNGQDVYITREIPFTTAVLGASLEIPSLDGRIIKVKVRPGTQPGTMPVSYTHLNVEILEALKQAVAIVENEGGKGRAKKAA